MKTRNDVHTTKSGHVWFYSLRVLAHFRYKLLLDFLNLHCKKRLTIFSSPAGMPLTKPALAGSNKIIAGQREFGK
jgi:hypothetical protein